MPEKKSVSIWQILGIFAAVVAAGVVLLVGFVFLTCGGVCR